MAIQNILAASDLSPQAALAVERAAFVAAAHGACLHLLHVLPAISWKMFGRVLDEHPLVTEKHLFDTAVARLDELAETCRARHGLSVKTCVEIGRPHREIAHYARSHAIDLTVLGAHAEHFVRDLFVGATARKFLQTGTHPVMIARSAPDAAYRTILVPVDFSELARTALDAARRFAPQASIYALHVYDVFFEGKMHYAGVEPDVIAQYRIAAHEEATRQMGEFLAGFAGTEMIVPLLRHGYPAPTILKEAQALQADLVVMGKRGRSELDHMLLGSVTESVLTDLERDLFLVGER